MKLGVQLGARLCGLALSVAVVLPCLAAQRSKDQPPPRQQQNRPVYHPQTAPHRNDRPAYRPEPSPRGGRNESAAPQYHPPRPENRPPAYDNRRATNDSRPSYDNRPRGNDNRASSQDRAPAQNPQERLRNMTPADRQRLAQREEQFRRLPPQQKQEMQRREQVWGRMTPEQRDHIRNDILPKWQQMSPDRQRAIQHRLGVLQNMPEDARNRHLNDPSFTRGMSEEDKSMLRDLAHQHVGSAPEAPPPSEQ